MSWNSHRIALRVNIAASIKNKNKAIRPVIDPSGQNVAG